MLKRLVALVIVSVLSLTSYAFGGNNRGNNKPLPWLGIFTVDDIPSSFANRMERKFHCEIVGIGGMFSERFAFTAPEPDVPLRKCKNCYLNDIGKVIDEATEALAKDAQNSGYNAILGYKVVITSNFDGFHGSVINGNLGYGYGYVVVMGTPIKVACSPPKRKRKK